MNKLKIYLTNNHLWPLLDIFIFAIITWGFHKLWYMFFFQSMSSAGVNIISEWLASKIYISSAWLDAHIFCMKIELYPTNVIYFVTNNRAIEINENCSGFKQLWQVLILFLLFPGPWKQKIWFIPLGMALMLVFNIFRVVGLSYSMIHWPQHWDIIHLWILRPIYYFIIFMLWVFWVEKFGGIKRYFEPQ